VSLKYYDIVVGLGNPGQRYAKTRHNAGFMVVDELLARCGSGSKLQWQERFGGNLAEGVLTEGVTAGNKLLLFEPLSFMNRSGEPVRELLTFYKGQPTRMVVVHDEIDLPFGELRLKVGGGDGGHNGIRSLVQALGTKDFARVRVGVGRPGGGAPGGNEGAVDGSSSEMEVADWVLQRFTAEQQKEMEKIAKRAAEAIECLCSEGITKAQNRFNSKV
jgi:peptidyl-tRNA hydrolase, PTH1 family